MVDATDTLVPAPRPDARASLPARLLDRLRAQAAEIIGRLRGRLRRRGAGRDCSRVVGGPGGECPVEQLRRRDAILKAIAISGAELLRSTDLQQTLASVFERVGRAAGVSRCHLFEVSRGGGHSRCRQRHIWRLPGLPVHAHRLAGAWRDMEAVGLRSWIARMERGEFVMAHAHDPADTAAPLLAAEGTCSVLLVPVMINGEWVGYVGFDDALAVRHWSALEIDTAQTLAALVGAALVHERQTRELAAANRVLMNSSTLLFHARPEPGLPLAFISSNVAQLGVDADELLRHPRAWTGLMHPVDRRKFKVAARRLLRGSAPMLVGDFRLRTADGGYRWFESRTSPVRDAKGVLVRIEGLLLDISERKKAGEEIERLVAERGRQLAEIEQIYRYAPVGLCLVDRDYRYVRINEHLAAVNGLPIEAHLGRRVTEVFSGSPEQILDTYARVMERGEPVINGEISMPDPAAPDGQSYFLASHFPFRAPSGEITGAIAAVLNVSDRKRAINALHASEERFRTIFQSVSDLIVVHDVDTCAVVDVNPSACEAFGYPREEMLRLTMADLLADCAPHTAADLMPYVERARAGAPQMLEWRGRRKDGTPFWTEVSFRRVALGGRDFILATARDITLRKEAEERLTHMAQFDPLTELSNRRAFVAAIEREIAQVRRGGSFAILSLDLDHFKDINDTLGHPIGDRLLQSVAERLRANRRPGDVIARFGGDEFAILMPGAREPAEIAPFAARLIAEIGRPFPIGGNEIHLGTSIGIATYEPRFADPETLLTHADLALYRAKQEGRGAYRFFTAVMDVEVRDRVLLTTELRRAMALGELFLDYQPQVDARTGCLVGLECLVRWRHPQRGVLLPGAFIEAAERSGLIGALGAWVMRAACRQARDWLDAGLSPPPVAVNVSALHFRTPLELERDLEDALGESGLPPQLLELELTESAIMESSRERDHMVARLRARGLRIAIDDFGTGYSSLLYLRNFPVDRIKIAREFIDGISDDANDRAIVKAAIGLARELGIDTLAEGVENAEQIQLLHDWGCHEVQGFFFARPMSPERVASLLRQGNVLRWLAAESDETPAAARGAVREKAG